MSFNSQRQIVEDIYRESDDRDKKLSLENKVSYITKILATNISKQYPVFCFLNAYMTVIYTTE